MDMKIFKAINRMSGRIAFMDFLMILISNRARYLFLFVLVCMWLAKGSSKTAAKKAAAASLIAILVNKIIKICYFKPRPFIKNKVGILIPAKRDSSFPSKHTVVSFAASIVIFYGNRFIGRILLWVSALTGFARIWAGHHYPSDVIGGALIGGTIGWMTEKCLHLNLKEGNQDDKKM
ncbi:MULTISPECIES: phosphatase PAP2 family protein [Cytobacillus]|jgi:undecaprenyl-diphosphatase|uniref:Undecaprenyl-diphosphatase n=2 Tax=Cytobacillus oceanisediminis TaxID=665099 RepID=A0A160MFN5_9BACI|nr:phosphatase PAP2 family protein [Cytobacillus oceanisediminis]MBY0159159.1 phosphatase PAP2 family protein [Cytobacillus firmus]AND42010.1 undecaprenyl-diphosphatase [Cytobacillus oceanisediminis 2691]MBU8730992.1 phosphatase PAP2 family protein [Cytobacillus oceanisediminis]MCM3393616.1 phosphatase PAP2 family protein [Cytobacillus oceanisediminis]MCM3529345.1 phosphatase PAP2 family protein [Cytobacillus oceanisediminis]